MISILSSSLVIFKILIPHFKVFLLNNKAINKIIPLYSLLLI